MNLFRMILLAAEIPARPASWKESLMLMGIGWGSIFIVIIIVIISILLLNKIFSKKS